MSEKTPCRASCYRLQPDGCRDQEGISEPTLYNWRNQAKSEGRSSAMTAKMPALLAQRKRVLQQGQAEQSITLGHTLNQKLQTTRPSDPEP